MSKARAYAYTAVTTAIVLLFALAEWAAERYVSGLSRAGTVTLEVAILFAATLAFRPIHQRVEGAIEAAFNKRKHQALASLAKFRRELSSFSDVSQLLRRVIEAVEHHLEAPACAVYLRRDVFRAEASSFDVAAGDVAETDPLIIRLRSSGAPAQPQLLQSAAQGTHAFPMTAAGDLVGFLLVHCKHAYDDDESEMLSGLAQDLAVALIALDPKLRPQTAATPNNLPANLPALVGRDRETAEIEAALAQSRLVTITGAGGVGKTCMALACAAAQMQRHRDGAWFVDLAPLSDADLIAATMLAALCAASTEDGDERRKLLDYLKPRDAIVIIDNCEHLVSAVTSLVAEIQSNCPRIAILATSRELLHVEGEQVYRLGPLRMEAAVELFAQRAVAVAPDFDANASAETVRRICEKLDGIPLAVELAAARVRALSPQEILGHLDERFRILTNATRTVLPRHQTLAETIEWSYGLLPQEEQSLFRRLSVFRGTFTLAAAAAVCAQDGTCDEFHVLDVLTSLADKSLVVTAISLTTRYRLLETIREFAARKAIEAQAESIARHQHASYFASVAAQAYHEFDTRLPQGWLARLAPDVDNFRAALEWTLEGNGDRQTGAQLAADCGPIFLRLQLLNEGLRWCDAARAVPDLPPATAGRIEYVASMMHNNLGRYEAALESAQRATKHYECSADLRGLVRSVSQVAQQFAQTSRFDEAKQAAMSAIVSARRLDEPRIVVSVLRRCAVSLPASDIEEARSLFDEALQRAQDAGDDEETCLVLQWWAVREAGAQQYERAMALGARALACADGKLRMYLEGQLACYALAAKRFEDAEPHATRALELACEARHPLLTAMAVAYCAPRHSYQNPREAVMFFGFANARLNELHWKSEAELEVAFKNTEDFLMRTLDASEFASLSAAGARMPEDEIVELALSASRPLERSSLAYR
ncbi:MAG TPA: NB-ARC domain-containing protein [Candidatus Baltobacteraceae bacterium]